MLSSSFVTVCIHDCFGLGVGGWFCHLFLKNQTNTLARAASQDHEINGDFAASWLLLTMLPSPWGTVFWPQIAIYHAVPFKVMISKAKRKIDWYERTTKLYRMSKRKTWEFNSCSEDFFVCWLDVVVSWPEARCTIMLFHVAFKETFQIGCSTSRSISFWYMYLHKEKPLRYSNSGLVSKY